ncbi:hypothetical protein [Sphingomonas sp. AP4-R1]|uniref:hypothetical protein n=1 Tax=Sphingomonas sp. AP4-R1 TaxID=2735134 RepID=UPI0020A274B8|nr:hypothetical protein [Sphingomonas sp. AP4-R1]
MSGSLEIGDAFWLPARLAAMAAQGISNDSLIRRETMMPDDRIPDAAARRIALALVEHCVRKSGLETFHAGIAPGSVKGDYSDVKVVTPYREIA